MRGALLLLLAAPFLLGFGPPPALLESDDARLPMGSFALLRLDAARPPAQIGRASLVIDRKSVV